MLPDGPLLWTLAWKKLCSDVPTDYNCSNQAAVVIELDKKLLLLVKKAQLALLLLCAHIFLSQ